MRFLSGLPTRAHFADFVATVWDDSKRLCNSCHAKLSVRENPITRAFLALGPNIPCLERLSAVCDDWRKPAIYCLSTLFQIQYKRPTQVLTSFETNMLLQNYKYWAGHSRWIVQFLKAVTWSDPEASQRAIDLLKRPRSVSCDQLRCSPRCREVIPPEDALELLSSSMPNVEVRRHAVECLKSASRLELRCYLSRLVADLRHEPPNSHLAQFLLSQALEIDDEKTAQERTDSDLKTSSSVKKQKHEHFNASNVGIDNGSFASDLYWTLKMAEESNDRATKRMYSAMTEKLISQTSPKRAGFLINAQLMVAAFERYADEFKKSGSDSEDTFRRLQPQLVSALRILDHPLTLPTDPRVCIDGFQTDKMSVQSSKTAPIILPCVVVPPPSLGSDRECMVSSVQEHADKKSSQTTVSKTGKESVTLPFIPHPVLMYKPEDLRKDQVILSLVRLIDIILKRELKLDLHIVAYNAVPTSVDGGLVQIVTDAATLYKISTDKQSLIIHMLKHQKESTIASVHATFARSLAAWTIIQFLLGIGDRHMDNIMVTHDGVIFHIDFGWVLGKDPKPMMPRVRVDKDMIEAIGGEKDAMYQEYKDFCIE